MLLLEQFPFIRTRDTDEMRTCSQKHVDLVVVSHHPLSPIPPLHWSFPTLPNFTRRPKFLDPKGTLRANTGDMNPVLIPLLMVMSFIDVAFKQCHDRGKSIHLN